MLKKFSKYLIISILIISFTLVVNYVYSIGLGSDSSGELWEQMQGAGDKGFGTRPSGEFGMVEIVAVVIKAFLSLLGVIFVVLIIVAGYNWMTAAGDEEKVTKAKQTLQRAVIGLIIIIAAYAITYFVFSNLPGGVGGADVTEE